MSKRSILLVDDESSFRTLIGRELSIDEVAAAAGTIGYEILTRLGLRCHLSYRSG